MFLNLNGFSSGKLLKGISLLDHCAFLEVVGGGNPDLGEASPRPPVEGRGAAPQTPLHKVWLVCCVKRFALASQWESICGWGFIGWGRRLGAQLILLSNL
jgi:hypothetical protein